MRTLTLHSRKLKIKKDAAHNFDRFADALLKWVS